MKFKNDYNRFILFESLGGALIGKIILIESYICYERLLDIQTLSVSCRDGCLLLILFMDEDIAK